MKNEIRATQTFRIECVSYLYGVYGFGDAAKGQLAKAQTLAQKEGFEKFIAVQGYYNLIFREEEREMVSYCGEDSYVHLKYDHCALQDCFIIQRAAGMAEKGDVSITEIALAWLITQVAALVVGTTKLRHVKGVGSATV